MNKELIAVAFSDTHFNDWPKFNANMSRTLNQIRALNLILGVCERRGIPALFTGDFVHKPETMSLVLFQTLNSYFHQSDRPYPKLPVVGISGNHDMVYTNSLETPSPSWYREFCKMCPSTFICIDWDSYLIPGTDIRVHGVPYLDHNIGLNDWIKNLKLTKSERHILLLHTDYPGAKDTDGVEVGSVENLNTNLLDKFNLVLIGHIHKPQRLSKKVYMIGATMQQRRTDKDCDLGYWEIFSDLSLRFHPLGDFPKFIDVTSEEDILDDGNYYTVVSKPIEVKEDVNRVISRDMSKKKIVRRYLREKGIKDSHRKRILLDIIKEASDD